MKKGLFAFMKYVLIMAVGAVCGGVIAHAFFLLDGSVSATALCAGLLALVIYQKIVNKKSAGVVCLEMRD